MHLRTSVLLSFFSFLIFSLFLVFACMSEIFVCVCLIGALVYCRERRGREEQKSVKRKGRNKKRHTHIITQRENCVALLVAFEAGSRLRFKKRIIVAAVRSFLVICFFFFFSLYLIQTLLA